MQIRLGGPFPIRFDVNGLMFSGFLFGVVGVAISGAAALRLLSKDTRLLGGRVGWSDVGLGICLLGMALYFLGRIVQLMAYLRRKR